MPESFRSFASRLPLSRTALDRDHLSRSREIVEILAEGGARVLVISRGSALLASPRRLALLPPEAVTDPRHAVYLGRAREDFEDLPVGAPVVVYVLDDDAAAAISGDWGDLRVLGAQLDDRDAGLFTAALAVANWHGAYGFSPSAGVATIPAMAGWMRKDPQTGAEFFPRTDPAVIVGVTDDDDRLLLGSNALWERGRFSLLAGFVEAGESLESAVAREVFEESGLRVVDPFYLGSQPWPFPASLMLGFRASVAPGTSTEVRPDGEEILELRWFSRDELVGALGEVFLPGPTSIARAIIEDWYGSEIEDGSRG
jgi:NAD+ diphosphatase